MKQQLRTILRDALDVAFADLEHDAFELEAIQVDVPRNPEHGDFSTNIALVLAKPLKMPPRELAARVVAKLADHEAIEAVEIAGPGFINLRLATSSFMQAVRQVLEERERYGRTNSGQGRRVQIEFVSANPTGPLHVGHGRGAAYGSVLANIFSAAGYEVEREYYVNDAGRQMDILAASLHLRYLELGGAAIALPANAYQGDYIVEMASKLRAAFALKFDCSVAALKLSAREGADSETALDELIESVKVALGPDSYAAVHAFARDEIIAGIRADLSAFGVEFDRWFYESDLARDGSIERALDTLDQDGRLYAQAGARWFKSTDYGDEKDRVVVRENGSPTYFTSDIAYHQHKYQRGYGRMINIWGADHHGYIARVKAAIDALGLDPEKLEILLVQFAALYRNGEKVAMSTRTGEFVTLAELVHEVGRDAARFFYSTRRSEQHLDFDLDLAKSQSNDNPVYYVQYAHARICSVFRQLPEKSYAADLDLGLEAMGELSDPNEKELAARLMRYPEVIENAVNNREPHLITTYLRELAGEFHHFYNSSRILIDNARLRNARLVLIEAVRQVLHNGLELLGVAAPETM